MSLEEGFKKFKYDAIRIETLPKYNIPEEKEALENYSRGQVPDFSFLKNWHDYLDGVIATGRNSRRIRLLSNKLTLYEKVELNAYRLNIKHGEQIRIIKRSKAAKMTDVWIFDNSQTFKMVYDPSGAYIGSRLLSQKDARPFIEWVDKTWFKAQSIN